MSEFNYELFAIRYATRDAQRSAPLTFPRSAAPQ